MLLADCQQVPECRQALLSNSRCYAGSYLPATRAPPVAPQFPHLEKSLKDGNLYLLLRAGIPQKKWSRHHGQQKSPKYSTWMQFQK